MSLPTCFGRGDVHTPVGRAENGCEDCKVIDLCASHEIPLVPIADPKDPSYHETLSKFWFDRFCEMADENAKLQSKVWKLEQENKMARNTKKPHAEDKEVE